MPQASCFFTRKICHRDRREAQIQLSQLKRRKGYVGGVYRCEWCGWLHVGRQPRKT